MKYQIKYYTDEDDSIHVITECESMMNKVMTELSHEIYKTRDEAIKRSLIKLGWTPPVSQPNTFEGQTI